MMGRLEFGYVYHASGLQECQITWINGAALRLQLHLVFQGRKWKGVELVYYEQSALELVEILKPSTVIFKERTFKPQSSPGSLMNRHPSYYPTFTLFNLPQSTRGSLMGRHPSYYSTFMLFNLPDSFHAFHLPPNLYYNSGWTGIALCAAFTVHKHPWLWLWWQRTQVGWRQITIASLALTFTFVRFQIVWTNVNTLWIYILASSSPCEYNCHRY